MLEQDSARRDAYLQCSNMDRDAPFPSDTSVYPLFALLVSPFVSADDLFFPRLFGVKSSSFLANSCRVWNVMGDSDWKSSARYGYVPNRTPANRAYLSPSSATRRYDAPVGLMPVFIYYLPANKGNTTTHPISSPAARFLPPRQIRRRQLGRYRKHSCYRYQIRRRLQLSTHRTCTL